ncbi:hypothetical protein AVEN_219604-1 [Araneus ventricosus]|uniref:Uncharacterized protein n=1 Tax=Araneus ventricosus TaxID=182803 RepID=A0A4Y1ZJ11_ARAVE|nr:hypothetical protein AVEN_219604-1 [Araneus ventricosus]
MQRKSPEVIFSHAASIVIHNCERSSVRFCARKDFSINYPICSMGFMAGIWMAKSFTGTLQNVPQTYCERFWPGALTSLKVPSLFGYMMSMHSCKWCPSS